MADQEVSPAAPRSLHQQYGRQLHGTAFLGLEHTLYMIIVTVLPLVVLCALSTVFSLWTSNSSSSAVFADMVKSTSSMMAVMVAAWLVLLAPLAYLFNVRTRSEIMKRPGFTSRLAYKLPIYGSLGVIFAVKISIIVMMLWVVLYSLVAIGTGLDIGSLYMQQFLPGLVALAVVGFVELYVFRLAKGVDTSSQFMMAIGLVSVVLVLTLLITAANTLHKPESVNPRSAPDTPRDLPRYFDY